MKDASSKRAANHSCIICKFATPYIDLKSPYNKAFAEFNGMNSARIFVLNLPGIFHGMEIYNYYGKTKSILLSMNEGTTSTLYA